MNLNLLAELAAGKAPDSLIVALVSDGVALEEAKETVKGVSDTVEKLREQARSAVGRDAPDVIAISLVQTYSVTLDVARTIVDAEVKRAADRAAYEEERRKGREAQKRLWGIPLLIIGLLLVAPTGGGSVVLVAMGGYWLIKGKSWS